MDGHCFHLDDTIRYLHIAMQEIVALPLALDYRFSIKRDISPDGLRLADKLGMESRCNVKND